MTKGSLPHCMAFEVWHLQYGRSLCITKLACYVQPRIFSWSFDTAMAQNCCVQNRLLILSDPNFRFILMVLALTLRS